MALALGLALVLALLAVMVHMFSEEEKLARLRLKLDLWIFLTGKSAHPCSVPCSTADVDVDLIARDHTDLHRMRSPNNIKTSAYAIVSVEVTSRRRA